MRLVSIILVAAVVVGSAVADRYGRRDGSHYGHNNFGASSSSSGPSSSYGVPAVGNGHQQGSAAPSSSYGVPSAGLIGHGHGHGHGHGAPSSGYGAPVVAGPSHSYGAPAAPVHKKGGFKKGGFGKGHFGKGAAVGYDVVDSYGGGGWSSSGSAGGLKGYGKGGLKKGKGKHHKYVYVGTYYDRPEIKPSVVKFKIEKGVKKWWKELALFAKKLYKYRAPYDYTYGKQYTIPKVKKVPVVPVHYEEPAHSYGPPSDSYGPPPSDSYGPPQYIY